jgi:hypothetical protein
MDEFQMLWDCRSTSRCYSNIGTIDRLEILEERFVVMHAKLSDGNEKGFKMKGTPLK